MYRVLESTEEKHNIQPITNWNMTINLINNTENAWWNNLTYNLGQIVLENAKNMKL